MRVSAVVSFSLGMNCQDKASGLIFLVCQGEVKPAKKQSPTHLSGVKTFCREQVGEVLVVRINN